MYGAVGTTIDSIPYGNRRVYYLWYHRNYLGLQISAKIILIAKLYILYVVEMQQYGSTPYCILPLQGGVTYILTVGRSATGVKVNGQGLQKLSSHRSNKKLHGQETKQKL